MQLNQRKLKNTEFFHNIRILRALEHGYLLKKPVREKENSLNRLTIAKMENDTNNEIQDSINLDEEINLETNDNSVEDTEKLKELNKKLYERAKKAEADKKALAEQLKQKPQEITRTEYTLNDEVVDLRLDGYSKQDVDFIMKNGGRKALEDKNSYVSIALNTKREQAKAEAEASKGVDTSGQSEFERKYTPEMLKNMTKEELAKILPHT